MTRQVFIAAALAVVFLSAFSRAESEEKQEKQLRLHIATWNVNEGDIPDDVEELLGVKQSPIPDIVVVGLQEITMDPGQAIINNLFDDKWTKHFEIVMSKWGYERVKTKRMVGVLLNVFVLLEHSKHVDEVTSEAVQTGFGGFYGNKGGVIITMEIYGAKMRFINSHLHANDGELRKRIEDYVWIARNIKDSRSIDYSFWLGDLNFRLEDPYLDADTIKRKIIKDDYLSLLSKDQLKRAMADGTAFGPYTEQAIEFRPTYKLFRGSDDYNAKRRPAWTDRILYIENARLIPNRYTNLPEYVTSDHRPVVADFTLNLQF